jgi:hypothetical protein
MASSRKIVAGIFAAFIALVAGVAVALWAYDIYQDRQIRISIEGPVCMYEAPELAAYPRLQGKPIMQLNPGEAISVLRVRYGKDYMAIKLQTANESIGWVCFDRNIRIIQSAK